MFSDGTLVNESIVSNVLAFTAARSNNGISNLKTPAGLSQERNVRGYIQCDCQESDNRASPVQNI